MKTGDFFIDRYGKKHQLVLEDDEYFYSHFKEYGGETICLDNNILTRFLKSTNVQPEHDLGGDDLD